MMPTLSYARFIRQMTQQDLAVLTGLNQGTISSIERGFKMPNDVERRKLAAALNVPEGDLIFPQKTPEEIKAKST